MCNFSESNFLEVDFKYIHKFRILRIFKMRVFPRKNEQNGKKNKINMIFFNRYEDTHKIPNHFSILLLFCRLPFSYDYTIKNILYVLKTVLVKIFVLNF